MRQSDWSRWSGKWTRRNLAPSLLPARKLVLSSKGKRIGRKVGPDSPDQGPIIKGCARTTTPAADKRTQATSTCTMGASETSIVDSTNHGQGAPNTNCCANQKVSLHSRPTLALTGSPASSSSSLAQKQGLVAAVLKHGVAMGLETDFKSGGDPAYLMTAKVTITHTPVVEGS